MQGRFKVHSNKLLISTKYTELNDGIARTWHDRPSYAIRLNGRSQLLGVFIIAYKT